MSLEREIDADVLVVGGGLGGIAAALALLRRDQSVVVSEETIWIGGQLTSQATPPDEHAWIESFGCTASYRKLRDGIRAYYRRHFPLTRTARADPRLNPGAGLVGNLCHEPRVAASVLEELIAPFVASGRLQILRQCRPVGVESVGDAIRTVTFAFVDGAVVTVHARFFLDATELGDLLPVAGIEFLTGSESQADTGEPHASPTPRPDNVQAFTIPFAVEHLAGEDHTIERPRDYAFWSTFVPAHWPGRFLSFVGPDVRTMAPRAYMFEPNRSEDSSIAQGSGFDLWAYRRILATRLLSSGAALSDVTIINWPMNDYFLGSLIGVDQATVQDNIDAARQLSLSLMYWLQTEAPRSDGGIGWRGLRLRGDCLGTKDGLAMAPYIRESRRIRPLTRILEQDVVPDSTAARRPTQWRDSVGIGAYRIDLHPSTGGDPYIDIPALPFQIPMGSLIPVRASNVLAAAKNIGTTHVTNGCYRLHPVEWNIGEAAGALADFCLRANTPPQGVWEQADLTRRFQDQLVLDGFELAWPPTVFADS
jgi:hypothetical protein